MSEDKIDPQVITFHDAAVEIICAFHNNPYLSLRDVQWIRNDARAVFEAAERRVAELGGQPMRTRGEAT